MRYQVSLPRIIALRLAFLFLFNLLWSVNNISMGGQGRKENLLKKKKTSIPDSDPFIIPEISHRANWTLITSAPWMKLEIDGNSTRRSSRINFLAPSPGTNRLMNGFRVHCHSDYKIREFWWEWCLFCLLISPLIRPQSAKHTVGTAPAQRSGHYRENNNKDFAAYEASIAKWKETTSEYVPNNWNEVTE